MNRWSSSLSARKLVIVRIIPLPSNKLPLKIHIIVILKEFHSPFPSFSLVYSTMRSLILLLFLVVVNSVHPERSNGAVPQDALWHIKMMSPPLEGENSIRRPAFSSSCLGCGDYSLCINGETSCRLCS